MGAWGSNVAAFGSNAASWGSNIAAWGCNAAAFGSNAGAWGSNVASWGSNVADWGCNAAAFGSNAASWGSNAAAFGSNAAAWGCNAAAWGSNGSAWGCNAAAFGSNAGAWGCNAAAWGSNTGAWGSNAGAWGCNAAAWGSNAAAWGCNAAAFGSNAATWGSNAAAFGSNAAAWGSNVASFGCNAASFGSNAASFGSNAAAFGCNAAAWGSNGAAWGCNAAAWGSNGAAWGSNVAAAGSNAAFAPCLSRSFVVAGVAQVVAAANASIDPAAEVQLCLSNAAGGALSIGVASAAVGEPAATVLASGGADLAASAAWPGVAMLSCEPAATMNGARGFSSNASMPYPPAPMTSAACALCNVMYGGGVYAATASSDSLSNSAYVPFSGVNPLGAAAGVCWTSLPGYTAINGFAYSATRTVPTTVVDGVSYAGEWLQLALPAGAAAGALPPTAYAIVPQLSTGTTGAPSGQPTCFVLAGSPSGRGGDWTTLDATYASTAYKPANAATSSTCPTTTAAARSGASIRAVRLIVLAISVSSSPAASTLPCSVCALQLWAPTPDTVVAAGAGVALITGMLGLGTATPQQRLDVRGSALVSGSLGVGGLLTPPAYLLQLQRDSAAKPSTSTWTVFSDRRLKADVQPCDVERCYEIVKSVPLSRFTWRDDVHSPEDVPDRSKLGWIAQDVAAAFPKAVAPQAAHGLDDCLSLNVDQMLMALYGAVQHLQAKLEALSSL